MSGLLLIIIESFLLGVAGLFLGYVLLLTFLAARVKLRTRFVAKDQRRFAVVVPAHNEESGISKTLAAIRAIDYPAERFDMYVIADNCSDATASVARASGATLLERTDESNRGKGYALRWAFDRLLSGPDAYDAFVVIDADTVPSSNFLTVMNWYLQWGAAAVQSSDLVAPGNTSWNAQMTRIGFYLYNYVRPLGRRVLGGTAGLRGNGMCFRRETLKRVPWSAFSIGEDLEYGLDLLLHGVRVEFAPEAAVHAIMPENAENAVSQRSRWEGSRFSLIKAYSLPLLRLGFRERWFAGFDAFLDLVIPAMMNLIGVTLVLGIISAVLFLLGFLPAAIPLLWGVLFAAGVIHLVLGLKIAGADASTYRSLLAIPRYALWKIQVYAGMGTRGTGWVRTSRE